MRSLLLRVLLGLSFFSAHTPVPDPQTFLRWVKTCIVLLLGFGEEFSSLATFTVWRPLELQRGQLSVAAYFFVVGRYGINNSVSIAGVTGDVIDIGRELYLVELAGTGIELYPTGRIVVFGEFGAVPGGHAAVPAHRTRGTKWQSRLRRAPTSSWYQLRVCAIPRRNEKQYGGDAWKSSCARQPPKRNCSSFNTGLGRDS